MKHSSGGVGSSASAVYGKIGQSDHDSKGNIHDAAAQREDVANFDGVVDGGCVTVGIDSDAAMTYQKGEIQPRGYKDKWFAVAFLSHFVVLIGLAIAYAPSALKDGAFSDRRNLAVIDEKGFDNDNTLFHLAETAFREICNVGRAKDARVSNYRGDGRRSLKKTSAAVLETEPYYFPEGDDDETIEEVVEEIASYYDDDLVKEETIDILDEIIEDYYEEKTEEELPTITYYGSAGKDTAMMSGMNGTRSTDIGGLGEKVEGVEGSASYMDLEKSPRGEKHESSGHFTGEESSLSTNESFESTSFGGGNDDDAFQTMSFDHFGATIGVAVITGVLVSPLFFLFLMKYPKNAIKTSLFTNVIYFSFVGLLGVANGDSGAGFRGFFFAFVSVLFGLKVWKRVAFSASLLKASTKAIMANLGLFAYSFLTFAGSMLYYVFWIVCLFATIGGIAASTDDSNSDVEDGSGAAIFIAILFLALCFYWSIYVFAHVLHVTVAGTVGTFWFTPIEASSCCSKGLNHSFIRASTDSFGSICFASLLIAAIETLRLMARSNRRNGILTCIVSCLLYCLAAFMEIFNRWSLVYVGLYGYPYIEAGQNVLNLFKAKGWTTIVSECTIASVIRLANLSIGVVTGVVSGVIAYCIEPAAVDFEVGFWIGFIVGIITSGNVFGVLLSASETVFVCFAEAPTELEENHPELGREMNEAWTESWPEIYHRRMNELTLEASECRSVV